MHGFRNILRNNKFCYLILLLMIVGCGSSKRIEKEKSDEELKDFLAKYEKTFDPSVYNPAVESIRIEEQKLHDAVESASIVEVAIPETVPGFRIQVLFTTEIEEANRIRDSLTFSLPEQWVYIIFDTPYYKVRIGNFAQRYDAQGLLKKLISIGYNEAWIVPDKIIKNAPPPSHEMPLLPDDYIH